METKTAKVASVQENQRNFTGQYGTMYTHLIKFEGMENTWEYRSKKTTCEKFKVGETVTADFEIKQNGQYTNYIVRPKDDQQGGGKKGYEQKDSGIITYLSCFSSACNFYAQRGQTTQEEVLALAERGFQEAMKHSTLLTPGSQQPAQAPATNGAQKPADPLPALEEGSEKYREAVKFLTNGGTIEQIEKKYYLSPTVRGALTFATI